MIIGIVEQYLTLLELQLLQRDLAGGELDDAAEDQFTNDLDACWGAMSLAEIAETERRFAESRDIVPAALQDLGFEDVCVVHDCAPRRAA